MYKNHCLPFDYNYHLDFYSLEPEETVRRIIPFEACLQQFCSDEIVSRYMNFAPPSNSLSECLIIALVAYLV